MDPRQLDADIPGVRPARARAAITERADHWELRWADELGCERIPTATKALAAARERGRLLAGDSGASVVVIEWQPTTAIGRRIVRALQD